ncbi:M23 family metallopeptidase, partial [Gammaproteobacteria bacterium]|nr:M23 family metallopeptidase [Gammaproteobacteria bacterium]
LKNDIPESVIMDLAYIFGWDIDFIFDIRTGDRFRVLYETPFADGQQIENGSILFAEIYNQDKRYTAFRFEGKKKKWEYFNENGGSLEKAFLRAPLDFAYVSSHFNPNRRHPILNTIRAHNGVDYAAKRGTPIRATGEGVIQSVGWKSGYGRTIVIRHGGDITTLYAHMDKYHSSITKGLKISQGQTIGYVGDSGLATAPHLHYEFRLGENRTDPLKVDLPSAAPLDQSQLKDFKTLRNKYIEISDQLSSKDPNESFLR